MNKKKYISIGVFAAIILIGGGVAYYVAPAAVDGALGIDSSQIAAVSDADISVMDDASSSPSAPDALMPPDDAPSAAAPAKNIAPSADKNASGAQTSGTSSPQEDAASPIGDADDDASTVSAVSSSAQEPSSPCAFPSGAPSTIRNVILNEIAWMGSASSSNAEWMELKNDSSGTVDLAGWELANASGKIKISFVDGDAIAPGGFLLLARGSASVAGAGIANGVSSGTKIYSGDLTNTGDALALMDPQCHASDYLDASNGWPGGSNATKQTLERDADGVGWHTSALPGGTPGAENSAGPAPARYAVIVSLAGTAAGASVTSDPAGLICGSNCAGNFTSGTRMTLTPVPGSGAAFGEWSGSCAGMTTCSFVVSATTSLTATFRPAIAIAIVTPAAGSGGDTDGNGIANPTVQSSTDSGSDDSNSPPSGDDGTSSVASSPGTPAAGHILIAAVQVAGASSSNDFVRLFNPTSIAVDMSGWKLHKKSQTGTDYSLKVFPTGSVIGPGQSFVWANSAGGFSESVGANVTSTETLSADNSVALIDAAGNIVDALAWGTGSGQYGEGPPYPTDPAAGQVLTRCSSNGVMADTDNNTNDFTLQ